MDKDKIMPNDLFHERMRFDSMNLNQLETRLQKITDRQKLENFIRVSGERKHFSLFGRAVEKYKTLFMSLPSYIEVLIRLSGGEPTGTSSSAGSIGSSSGYKPPIVIPKSNISPSLKGKKKESEEEEIVIDPYTGLPVKKKYLQKKKVESSKPVDIADVIYTKRKLRLE